MNLLVGFDWDCGRMGWLDGLFICTQEEYNSLIGKDVYFGEALGKHSEIYGTIKEENLTILSNDQEKIAWLESVVKGKVVSGRNPLDYLSESEDK